MVRLDDGIYLDWENAACDGNKIYFTDFDNNDLFVFDLETDDTCFLRGFSDDTGKGRMFGKIQIMGSRMLLIPFRGNKIYEMDRQAGGVNTYALKEAAKPYNGYSGGCFMNAHIYGNKLYLMGIYPAVVFFDADTKDICYWDDWAAEVTANFSADDEDSALFRKTLMLDGKIYAPMCRKNSVVVFDVVKREHTVYRVGNGQYGFSAICHDGMKFWLSPRSGGTAVCWDEKDNSFVEHTILHQKTKGRMGSFNDCVCFAGRVWFIPGNTDALISIDIKTGEMKIEADKCGGMSVSISGDGRKMLLYSRTYHLMWTVNEDGILGQPMRIPAPPERAAVYKAVMIREAIKAGNIITECFTDDLHSWLKGIRGYSTDEKTNNPNESRGQGIYADIMKKGALWK